MNDKPHILVVDDDDRLRALLAEYLTGQGFYVAAAPDTRQADHMLSLAQFDAMVLDVMMPGKNGVEWLRDRGGESPPTLFLSALGEGSQRIDGLEAGAQDYLAKPFEPRELGLRLRNILRRGAAKSSVRFGQFEFDLANAQLLENGAPVYLTTAEAQLLKSLAQQVGQPVSREALAGNDDGRSVDVQINRLRKKIESKGKPQFIQTVRGQGYMLRAEGA